MALSVISCKKEASDFQQSLIIKKKEVEIPKANSLTISNFDVGGTIGCTIRFADHNSSFYGDNDVYEKCFDEQTRKEATLPPGSVDHKQYPEAPC
ncbi:hypothetical protein [Pedobacter miscanthi]|jgi:hypothetical protein|uniref:hypothetical protein n=1 Tax=Pedobacter miscanthi TaxID=2259170 RepID=UPI00293021C8|nr:hypothetical protein [Pedobacter miscanthi]